MLKYIVGKSFIQDECEMTIQFFWMGFIWFWRGYIGNFSRVGGYNMCLSDLPYPPNIKNDKLTTTLFFRIANVFWAQTSSIYLLQLFNSFNKIIDPRDYLCLLIRMPNNLVSWITRPTLLTWPPPTKSVTLILFFSGKQLIKYVDILSNAARVSLSKRLMERTIIVPYSLSRYYN